MTEEMCAYETRDGSRNSNLVRMISLYVERTFQYLNAHCLSLRQRPSAAHSRAEVDCLTYKMYYVKTRGELSRSVLHFWIDTPARQRRKMDTEKERQRGHESIFMVRGEFCGVNWMPMSAVAVAAVAKKVAF